MKRRRLQYGRTLCYHLGNSQFHLGCGHSSAAEQPDFQVHQSLQETGPVQGGDATFSRCSLLAAETAWELKFLSIGPGESGRNTMQPAEHHSVRILRTEPILVKRAHHNGSLSAGKRCFTLDHIICCLGMDCLQLGAVKSFQAQPEIGPFCIGVVQEKTVTAIVRAATAGKTQVLCSAVVSILHITVEISYLFDKVCR